MSACCTCCVSSFNRLASLGPCVHLRLRCSLLTLQQSWVTASNFYGQWPPQVAN